MLPRRAPRPARRHSAEPLAVRRRHEGNRARDRLRKVKWWLLDRAKYDDIRNMNRRVDVEVVGTRKN